MPSTTSSNEKREYKNQNTQQVERLDPAAKETQDRLARGELVEVPEGSAGAGR